MFIVRCVGACECQIVIANDPASLEPNEQFEVIVNDMQSRDRC